MVRFYLCAAVDGLLVAEHEALPGKRFLECASLLFYGLAHVQISARHSSLSEND